MVKVERDIDRAAIDAVSCELLENVFPALVTGQRALLILDTGDFRVFEELHVEANPLDGDPGDRSEPS
jgi:hypothetical protein